MIIHDRKMRGIDPNFILPIPNYYHPGISLHVFSVQKFYWVKLTQSISVLKRHAILHDMADPASLGILIVIIAIVIIITVKVTHFDNLDLL